MSGFTTKSIHAKFLKKDAHNALHMPIYDSVAFAADTAEDLAASFRGYKPAHTYSRISNPTVEHFEQKIKNFSGASGVVATASGMAALSTLFLTIAGQGDNIVTTRHIFGNTYSLFSATLKQWGLETIYTDLTDLRQTENVINEKTRAIFLETITNPQLEVADIAGLAEIARRKKILLIADTTLTPPYLFDTPKFGVHLEVLSSTKYISGGATSLGGLILDYGAYDYHDNPHLAEQAKKFGHYALLHVLKTRVCRDLGNILSPHNAYLQSLGLETLVLRAGLSCANTLALARFLQTRPQVRKVNYPGLADSPSFALAQKQFPNGVGALLTFELDSHEKCFQFLNRLQLIRRATNLNDNKTLIIHPASTIFSEYTAEQKAAMGVPETLIRLAVGIEDLADLQEDLQQALEAA
ncbi:MAG: aminotransferase class I/II-fold pyridoxal phosphate-dependent enzyme [Candidatus Margulisbacteria bacterium]|jgi:O-acetylhomoserine (thiol)-lyase|nr:aminotransferase class I/II-fold pyridoxal phosphate-dependent enzyme [Candidatus Margulisiibacteriota bacterium]